VGNEENLRGRLGRCEMKMCAYAVSSFYETEPVDFGEAWFLNCASRGDGGPALELLRACVNRIANGEQKLVLKGPR